MSKKIALSAIILIFIIECVLFFWLKNSMATDIELYALLTRYSARISFGLIIAMMYWGGAKGLHHIFSRKESLGAFQLLILLLTINHLIHLYFVIVNYSINDWSLIRVKSFFGFIGYLSIVIMPFYLRNKIKLSKSIYRNVYFYLFIISLICFVKYAGRVFDQKFIDSPDQIIWVFMVVLTIALGLNVYRIIIDRKEIKNSIEQ